MRHALITLAVLMAVLGIAMWVITIQVCGDLLDVYRDFH